MQRFYWTVTLKTYTHPQRWAENGRLLRKDRWWFFLPDQFMRPYWTCSQVQITLEIRTPLMPTRPVTWLTEASPNKPEPKQLMHTSQIVAKSPCLSNKCKQESCTLCPLVVDMPFMKVVTGEQMPGALHLIDWFFVISQPEEHGSTLIPNQPRATYKAHHCTLSNISCEKKWWEPRMFSLIRRTYELSYHSPVSGALHGP